MLCAVTEFVANLALPFACVAVAVSVYGNNSQGTRAVLADGNTDGM